MGGSVVGNLPWPDKPSEDRPGRINDEKLRYGVARAPPACHNGDGAGCARSHVRDRFVTPMMELHVCNRSDGKVLRKFALGDAQEIIIGRDSNCDIRICAASVSREHCAIEQDENGAMILRDMDSTVGTFVEDQKIDAVRLEDGLTVSIGPAALKFFDAGI